MSADTEVNAYLQVIEQKDPQKWSVFYNAEKSYWTAEYKGALPAFKINMEIGGQFVYMQVGFEGFSMHPECAPSLWYYLLRLNEDLPIVKFGVLGNGMIVLMAELPLEMLSLNSFETILRLATEVFVQYRREIGLLASDHELANIILPPKSVERPPIVIKNSNP